MKVIAAVIAGLAGGALGGLQCNPLWGLCGGNGYSGPICCTAGACSYLSQWSSQCLPDIVSEPPSPEPGAACTRAADGFASLNGGTAGGAGGTTITVQNQTELEKYAGSAGKYVIKINGRITISPRGKTIKVADNKTIIGIDGTGEILSGGFTLSKVNNVIIRNLRIGGNIDPNTPTSSIDRVGILADASSNIWIDHCLFENDVNGLVQFRNDTNFWAVSNTIFRNQDRAFEIGWTNNLVGQGTVHHNLFNNTNQSNPSAGSLLQCHLYSNYVYGAISYGPYIQGRTNALIENSVFEKSNRALRADPEATIGLSGSFFNNCSGVRAVNQGNSFRGRDYYNYTMIPTDTIPAYIGANAGPRASVCPSSGDMPR